jgi:UDP-N-acetylmuramoyl-tripeptide--D-alanyl-D-alanine ligase
MEVKNIYEKFLASTGLTTDTRNIQSGNIFFALKGEKFNANQFAEEALEKGSAYVVIDEMTNPDWKGKFGEKLILVNDSLKALQQLSAYHRNQLKCPLLAITGSNGKTTTKELMAAVLAKKFKTYATKGNLNNHIGIPLTLLSIKPDAQFAIVEMGANHVGEIASYCEYAQPDYGLITNIGMAHTEGFGGFEGVIKGKTELYNHLIASEGKIFVNADNDLLLEQIKKLEGEYLTISYGKTEKAFCKGEVGDSKEFLSVIAEGETIQTNLIGEYNFENVLSAICVGKYFGVEAEKIKAAIENYFPTNNRSQKIKVGSNTVILDAYNANPSSMIEALKNFEKMEADNKVVILGEMMELGDYSQSEHEKIKQQVAEMPLAKKVFTGKGFSFLKNDPSFLYFETTDDLKEWFRAQQFENSYLLIKGSRKNELEKILKD